MLKASQHNIKLIGVLLTTSTFGYGKRQHVDAISLKVDSGITLTFRYRNQHATVRTRNTQFEKVRLTRTNEMSAIWSVVTEPVEQGLYPYSFMVGGISTRRLRNSESDRHFLIDTTRLSNGRLF